MLARGNHYTLLMFHTTHERCELFQTTHAIIPTLSYPRCHIHAVIPTLSYPRRVCQVNSHNFTVFPQSTSLAGTWNVSLLHAVAEAIGRESRGMRNAFNAAGHNLTEPPPALTCFSPQASWGLPPRHWQLQCTVTDIAQCHGVLVSCWGWGRLTLCETRGGAEHKRHTEVAAASAEHHSSVVSAEHHPCLHQC